MKEKEILLRVNAWATVFLLLSTSRIALLPEVKAILVSDKNPIWIVVPDKFDTDLAF